ncbi:hypothetical protein [Parafrankia elaeagni]|uniref:hypothetical protein n=1 Tax=Parafrankia elaeagni TaxID=222534 RepID=UPI0003790788|nr:hypothetical protein [Parafrankia elaeagni]
MTENTALIDEEDGSRWTAIDPEIFHGAVVQAVKRIREEFGGGLRDALDILVRRYERLRRERPDDFTVDVESFGSDVYT